MIDRIDAEKILLMAATVILIVAIAAMSSCQMLAEQETTKRYLACLERTERAADCELERRLPQ